MYDIILSKELCRDIAMELYDVIVMDIKGEEKKETEIYEQSQKLGKVA